MRNPIRVCNVSYFFLAAFGAAYPVIGSARVEVHLFANNAQSRNWLSVVVLDSMNDAAVFSCALAAAKYLVLQDSSERAEALFAVNQFRHGLAPSK